VKIKAIYDKVEDIPEGYKEIFLQKGEKWAIEIEGINTDASVLRLEQAIKKEREENAKLRDSQKLHLKTPEEVVALTEELEAAKATIESGSGKATEEVVQKLVEAQVRTKVGPLERSIVKLTKERDDSVGEKTKLSDEILHGKIELAIRGAAEKAKVIPSAISDMVMRGMGLMEVIDQDGKILVVTKDGVGCTPGLGCEGWIEELAPNALHYWPPNVGAGANGGGTSLGITERNPWTKANWNMTEKGTIIRKYGVEKAGQLAKAAGSSLEATVPPDK